MHRKSLTFVLHFIYVLWVCFFVTFAFSKVSKEVAFCLSSEPNLDTFSSMIQNFFAKKNYEPLFRFSSQIFLRTSVKKYADSRFFFSNRQTLSIHFGVVENHFFNLLVQLSFLHVVYFSALC